MRNKFITFIILSLFSFVYTATAQKLIDSPYSRFNIGALQPQGSFKSLSMGGVGTAMRDNTSIFFLNPASYSSLDTISFVFRPGSVKLPEGETRGNLPVNLFNALNLILSPGEMFPPLNIPDDKKS